jgi:hypothetical protein
MAFFIKPYDTSIQRLQVNLQENYGYSFAHQSLRFSSSLHGLMLFQAGNGEYCIFTPLKPWKMVRVSGDERCKPWQSTQLK